MKFLIVLCVSLTLANCQFDKQFTSVEFNKLYYYKATFLNHTTAAKLCKDNGAQLVQPRSKAEVDFIGQHVDYDFHIGAKTTQQSTPTTFLDGSKIEWIDWFPGYGTGSYLFDCTSLFINSRSSNRQYNRKWYTVSCSAEAHVVCERDIPVTFPVLRQIVDKLLEQQRNQLITQNETLERQSEQIQTMTKNITEQMVINEQTVQSLAIAISAKNELIAENERIKQTHKSRQDDYVEYLSDLKKNGFHWRRR